MVNEIEEQKKGVKEKSVFEQAWAFFSSMRVGLVLLLLLTGMSIYGATFMGHQQALEGVYGSWWFIGTLALTGLNLLICSINRWDSIWKRATVLRTDVGYKTLSNYKNKETLSFDGDDQEAAKATEELLKKKGYRTVITETDKGLLVSADKGRFGYFGSLVTHLSLVLILVAGLYGVLFGFEDFDAGFPGRIFRVDEAGFSVRIDDFRIDYRDDKSIEQYYSTLTIIDNGQEVKKQEIWVNNPLRYNGVVLYQSTYGWGVDLAITNQETGEVAESIIVPGQTYHHPETGVHVVLLEFFPDFSMTNEGVPFSRSAHPGNPRAAYRLLDAQGQIIGNQFYIDAMQEPVEMADGYVLEFPGFRNYTGFQIIDNPGKPLAFIASVLMILGLIMSFYLFPRRIYAYIGEETKGKVLLAGKSFRNVVGFEFEFKKLLNEIKNKWEG